MDSDVCPADRLPSAPSGSQFSDTVIVEGASDVDVYRQTTAAHPGSVVEELDSYNLIEPPPLDWRSDSSSEGGSVENQEDGGFPPDSLDTATAAEPVLPVLLPLDVSDPVIQLDPNLTELSQAPPLHQAAVEELGKVEDLKGRDGKDDQREVTFRDVENVCTAEESGNRDLGDEDHSRIQTLLSQLQLMGDESHPNHQTPPHHHFSSQSEQDECASSLIIDNSTETTGLLFSESHQRDVLGLLQCSEMGAAAHSAGFAHRGEVDAVVSVSYSQEDCQRFWGHHGNSPYCRHRDDSLSSLPDDEYPEPVWMKLGEEPPEEEAAAESKLVGL